MVMRNSKFHKHNTSGKSKSSSYFNHSFLFGFRETEKDSPKNSLNNTPF